MKIQLKAAGAAMMVLALAACGHTGYPKEKWTDFRAEGVQQQVAANDTNLVFFRGESGNPKAAVNIYINGEYHTSLQPNGYSQKEVCAQPQRLGAYVTGFDNLYKGKETGGNTYDLPKGQSAYFRVTVSENGQARLQPVAEEEAKQEIQAGKYQNNHLSRVDKASTCAPRELKKYVLNASALFPFDQSDSSTILRKGREEINAVAADIRRYPESVSRVEVIGYTDPQGSEAYNLALSERRANSVAGLIAKAGVPASSIYAVGRGEQNLLVTGCNQTNRAARLECNQPNRRVEIKLFGSRQQ